MQNPSKPDHEIAADELAEKRQGLADKLGYLLARYWLSRRDSASDPPDQTISTGSCSSTAVTHKPDS